MRETAKRGAGEGTALWGGMLISLLIGALAVGLAVYGASVGGPPPAAPARPDPAAPSGADQQAMRRQADLTAGEDARLLMQLRAVPYAVPAYVDRSPNPPTAVLTPRPAAYGVDDLVGLGAIRRPAPGVMELVMSVLVAPGARLEVHAPGSVLRMISTETSFTSLVAWKASMTLSGAPGRSLSVMSWDASAADADRRPDDGRAYVRAVGAELRIASAEVTALGFWSGRTGGIAFTGSDRHPATGAVVDSSIRAAHYGLFSSDTRDLRLENVTVEGAAADGVLLHRGTIGTQVHGVTVRASGDDGFVAARGSSAVTVSEVTVEGSRQNGIVVDGRPLVTEPGPSGASLDGSSGFRIMNSVSRGNGRAGVLVWDADDTIVVGNDVDGNAEGVIVRGPARGVTIEANTVTRSWGTGIGVRDGAIDVAVAGNTVGGATTGVQVRNARVAVNGNHTTGLRAHGVSVQGAAGGSAVLGNTFVGAGPSALDLYRLDAGATVAVSGNDTASWTIHRPAPQRVRDLFDDHPLLPLWLVLLAVPAVATILARIRRDRSVGPPYEAQASVVAEADGAAAAGARVVTEGSGTRLTVISTGWPRTGRTR